MPMSGTGRQLAQFGPDSENISLEAGHWKPDQSHKYGRFMSKYIQLFAELAHKSIKSGIYNISSIVPSIQQEMQSQGLSKEKSG
jgi:hypothetical protein